MKSKRENFFRTHKTLILSIGFLTVFSFSVSHAAGLVSPYTSGQTLDPQCAPADTNCYVSISTPSSILNSTAQQAAASFNISGSGISAGGFGVGQVTTGALSRSGIYSGLTYTNSIASATGARIVPTFVQTTAMPDAELQIGTQTFATIGSGNTADWHNPAFNASASTTYDTLIGEYVDPQVEDGPTNLIDGIEGIRVGGSSVGEMNVYNYSGISVHDPIIGTSGGHTGVIQYNIGIRINNQNAGTNNTHLLIGTLIPQPGNWMIYEGGGLHYPSYFNDPIQLGSTTPTAGNEMLQVTGECKRKRYDIVGRRINCRFLHHPLRHHCTIPDCCRQLYP